VKSRAIAMAACASIAMTACSSSSTGDGDAGSSSGDHAGDDGGNGNGNGSGPTRSGDATWYNTGLGACGVTNDDSQKIAALAIPDFDPFTPDGNPNHNTLCGKTATVCKDPSTCVTVTIEDRCVGCKSGDIDLSPAAFQVLAPLDTGRIKVTWSMAP
jgi:expansin (peptidoglycan-binding protein)